jgi:Bax protein
MARFSAGDVLVLFGCVLLSAGFLFPPDSDFEPMPDFSALDGTARKQAFFGYLSPLIANVNERARADREQLQRISTRFAESGELPWLESLRLKSLAERHEVSLDEQGVGNALTILDRRIGTVPESLVLVQAAMESGWGTSRFAREGNNLFGQRCYRLGCGLVPRDRASDAEFWVAEFDSVHESITSYVMNLNTHAQYRDFRIRRQQLREAAQPLTGLALADGLLGYSELGQSYVDEIRDLIRYNELE